MNPINAIGQGYQWLDGEGAQGVDWLKGELAKLGGLFGGAPGQQGAPGGDFQLPSPQQSDTGAVPAAAAAPPQTGPFADSLTDTPPATAIPVRATQDKAIADAQAQASADPALQANRGDVPMLPGAVDGSGNGQVPQVAARTQAMGGPNIAGVPIDPRTQYAKPNMLRVVGDVLGGMSIPRAVDYESRRPIQAAIGAQQLQYQQANMQRMQAWLGDLAKRDPSQAQLFVTDPQEWAKHYGTQIEDMALKPGEIRSRGDGTAVGASPAVVKPGEDLLSPVSGAQVGGVAPLPMDLAPEHQMRDPRTGALIAAAPQSPFAVGPSQSVYDPATGTYRQSPAAPVVQTYGPGQGVAVVNPNDPNGGTQSQGGFDANSYVHGIIGSEDAGGNPTARNPRSTAAGLGQFTDQTWLTLVRSTHPEMANVPDQQVLAMKSNPQLSQEMILANARANAPALQGARLPVNNVTLSVAHGLGPADGVKVLSADPKTPMSAIVSPRVMHANPQFARMTAGDYVAQRASQFGGGGSTQSGAGVRTAVQGAVPTTLSPQDARAVGLGPGLWQKLPTGEYKQVSAPTADDLKRVSDARGAAIAANDEAALEKQFLQHNAVSPTGMGYFGEGYNPLAQWQMHNGPHVKEMVALQAQQLFKMKPDNAGLRILQSELPWWEKSTMDIDNTYDVNAGIAKAHQQQAALANQRANFYENWLYSHPSMDGADQAWNAQALTGEPGPARQQGSGPAAAQQPARPIPVRRAPPQRQAGPPPGATKSATNANGQKVYLVNGQWVRAQ